MRGVVVLAFNPSTQRPTDLHMRHLIPGSISHFESYANDECSTHVPTNAE